MSKLFTKQTEMTRKLVNLLNFIHSHGYECTLGEAYRTHEQAAPYAKEGKAIKNSLHIDRLASDLNLFRGGVYLTRTEDYRQVGEYWESIGGNWGGRFNDSNHFSLSFDGRK